jgi:hypothetical protein
MWRSAITLLLAVSAMAGEPVVHVVDARGETSQPDSASIEQITDQAWPAWRGFWVEGEMIPSDPTNSAWRLLDGQCVMGGFAVDEGRLGWRSELLGVLQMDLERTRSIGSPTAVTPESTASDQLFMVNGDRVEGFITAFDPDKGIGMERKRVAGAEPEASWHPFGSVTLVQLSGREEQGSGWRFWLRDGSVVDVAGWSRDRAVLRLDSPRLPGAARGISLPWSMVRGIRPPQGGVHPLAVQAWSAHDGEARGRLVPAETRMMNENAPLGLRPVELAGPGRFVCPLPASVSRMHMVVELPARLRDSGGCTVALRVGASERARATLDADHPRVEWNESADAGSIEVDVQAGPGGALGSTLILREAWTMPLKAPGATNVPSTTAPSKPDPSPGPG